MNQQTKNEILEAVIYAVMNGVAAAAIYIGGTVFAGTGLPAAAVSGLAIGLAMFGSYLVREVDEIKLETPDLTGTAGGLKDNTKERVKHFFWPNCVRRHGLFRII